MHRSTAEPVVSRIRVRLVTDSFNLFHCYTIKTDFPDEPTVRRFQKASRTVCKVPGHQ